MSALAVRYVDGVVVHDGQHGLQVLFDNTPCISVQGYDQARRVIYWNKASEALYGFTREEALGKPLEDLIIPHAMQADVIAAHTQWVNGGKPIPPGELLLRRKDGSSVPVFSSHVMVESPSGEREMYCIDIDLSEIRKSEAERALVTYFDSLTGLPNRVMAQIQLAHVVEACRSSGAGVATLLVGIDRFKNINESFGHPVGDELLVEMARRLSDCLVSSASLARFGGDEFLITLERCSEASDAARVAQTILARLDEAFVLPSGQEVFTGASIGISLFPAVSSSGTLLIQHSDAALHQAKAEGRGTYRFFTAALTRTAQARIELETRMRWGIERDEFEMYYQPKINLANGRISGCEALIRWHDGERGLVSPNAFIPVAEETGLIVALGELALRQSCRQLAIWSEAGFQVTVAVNLSARQIFQSSLPARVGEIIRASGAPPECIELELTESMIMGQEESVIARMHDVKKLGVSLALDDFGTGYSSLAYLKRFPIDVLKIDRSFVTDIPEDNDSMEIASAIVAMARSLRLSVVAEGVETAAQVDFFRAHGCHVAQGFFFGRPMPASEFSALLQAERPV